MAVTTAGYRIVFDPEALRNARHAARLTQLDVQKATGIYEGTIGRYERGVITPSAWVLADLANLYGCSVLDFYPLEEVA